MEQNRWRRLVYKSLEHIIRTITEKKNNKSPEKINPAHGGDSTSAEWENDPSGKDRKKTVKDINKSVVDTMPHVSPIKEDGQFTGPQPVPNPGLISPKKSASNDLRLRNKLSKQDKSAPVTEDKDTVGVARDKSVDRKSDSYVGRPTDGKEKLSRLIQIKSKIIDENKELAEVVKRALRVDPETAETDKENVANTNTVVVKGKTPVILRPETNKTTSDGSTFQ